MERRPTWAKNFRRFGFQSLRSHSWAPSAQPLTSEAKENLRSIVLKGPFDKPSFEFFQVP